MFCPICKVEYRLGFYECSDCHVPLVDALAGDRLASDSTVGSEDLDAPLKLWDGIDPRTFAEIRTALDANQIPYNDEPQEQRLLRTFYVEPLQIWIRKADEEAARKILSGTGGDAKDEVASSDSEPASDSAPVGPENTSQLEAGSRDEDSADDGQVDDIIEDFDPDDATCEVWAGEDKQMAQIFEDCLRNVGIGCVVSQDGGKLRVLVLPSSEGRAREVVREIIEGIPPA